jgi:hypothetical protein
LAQDDLVSIDFRSQHLLPGRGASEYYSETLNYDLKNGKQLKLADLFKPGAKYLQAIATTASPISRSKHGQRFDAEEIDKGAAAKADNYQGWTITKRGLGMISILTRSALRRRSPIRARALFNLKGPHQPEGPSPIRKIIRFYP